MYAVASEESRRVFIAYVSRATRREREREIDSYAIFRSPESVRSRFHAAIHTRRAYAIYYFTQNVCRARRWPKNRSRAHVCFEQ